MRAYASILLAVAAAIAAPATITIENAYPSDATGNPVPVQLGDSFYLTAKLNVDGPLLGPYRIRFDLPYLSRTTSLLGYDGEATVTWGPYPALLEGPLKSKATIQTSTDAAGQPFFFEVASSAGTNGIEYFAPRVLDGWLSATANLVSGSSAGIQWYGPQPLTGGFQQVLTSWNDGSLVTSFPFGQPVVSVPNVDSVAQQFQIVASSCRANASILRSVTFDSYRSLSPGERKWLEPETLVESRSREIAFFTSRILPREFRSRISPYDAARALFQAVVARMTYATTPAKPDALVALRTGRGDCSYFSALFVACCRSAGIPARSVCGMRLGDNAWHVWAEFFLPGPGWIPVDPEFCDEFSPDGSQALYFGTIPDLNGRCALSYGFDHSVNGRSIPMLQSPAIVTSGATRVRSVTPSCSLAVVGP